MKLIIQKRSRLNIVIDATTREKLEFLARYYKMTMTLVIEKLIEAEFKELMEKK